MPCETPCEKMVAMRKSGCVVGLVVIIAVSPQIQAGPYKFTSVLSRADSVIGNSIYGQPVINNRGVTALMVGGGSTSLYRIGPDETAAIFAPGVVAFGSIDINDHGAVTYTDQFTLLRINPDNSITTLSNGSNFQEIAPFQSINNTGYVAVAARPTGGGETQIVRFEGPDQFTVIDSADAAMRFNFTSPDINDAGVVVYKAQSPSPGFVNVYSGTNEQTGLVISPVLPLPTNEGSVGAGPAINNNGLVAGQTPSSVRRGQNGVEEDVIVSGEPGVARIDINNFGQVVYDTVNSADDGLFIGTGASPALKIIQEGDALFGGLVASIFTLRTRGPGMMNDLGQVVFLVTIDEGGNNFTTHVVRADPTRAMTRDLAAIWLLLAKFGATFSPSTALGNVFDDVAGNDYAAAWIERLLTEGITEGCNSNNYCPRQVLTKEQAAKMLLRAKHGASFVPTPATGTVFEDVPQDDFAADWIEELVSQGIADGCDADKFCPKEAVTMPSFARMLANALAAGP